jgi:hypothetical protein
MVAQGLVLPSSLKSLTWVLREAPPSVAPARRAARRAESLLAAAPATVPSDKEQEMDVVYPRCCGLDVHKKTVVACLLTPGSTGKPTKEVRSFTTMSEDLLRLVDWVQAAGCTHLAMESTGVYWKPLYNLCEGLFTVLVVNAQHIKAVPRE